MSTGAREIFRLASTRQYEPSLRGVHGTYLFDIERVGSWSIAVDDGKFEVNEGKVAANCVISCDEQDFVDICEGRRNLVTATLQGRVQVRGDFALAQKFHGIVGAASERRRGAT